MMAVADDIFDEVVEAALDRHWDGRPSDYVMTAGDLQAWLDETEARTQEAMRQIQRLGPSAFIDALDRLGCLEDRRWLEP